MSIDDLSPSLSIPNENNELYVDEDFKETPLQNVGGLQVGSRELRHGKIRIAGIEERIYFGEATDFASGNGIIIGKRVEGDNDYYDFRFGDPEGNYVRWDEQAGDLTIVGTITAGTGSEVDWSYIENVAVKNIDIAETLTVSNTEADITQDELDAGASIDNAIANGSTFIQGGYIRTGIIDASRIDTGILNASRVNIGSTTDFDVGYDPSTKLDSSDVGNLADYDLVENAMEDETIITGGYIDTSYMTADNIAVGTLKGITVVSTDGGSDRIELTNGDFLDFYANGSLKASLRGSTTGSGGLFVEGDSDVYVENDNSFFIQDSSGTDSGYGGISVGTDDVLNVVAGTSDQIMFTDNNLGTLGGFTSSGGFYAAGDILLNDGKDIADEGSSVIIRSRANDGDWRTKGDIVPFSDNDDSLGASTIKWANVHSVNTNFGDVGFSNNWHFTEGYKLDIINKGLALVDENDELRYFFGKDEFYTPENIDQLDYNKKTTEERNQIQKEQDKIKAEETK